MGFLAYSICFREALYRDLRFFALGIMPYISASIIMQLMTAVSPTLEALKKRRVWAEKNLSVHEDWNPWLGTRTGVGISVALESQPGLVIDPGVV